QIVWPSRMLAAEVSPGSASGNQPSHASSPTAPVTAAHSHAPTPVNFDLSSTVQNVNASHILHNVNSANIVVNGLTQVVTPASLLTRAEAVAVSQVLRTGQQSLIIGSAGNAVGGSLTIGSQLARHIASLVIPQGVTAIDLFTRTSSINFSGNLTNAGSMYAVS